MVDKTHAQWWAFDGHNVDYLLAEYDRYLEDEQAVEPSLVPIFRVWQGLDGASEVQGEVAASPLSEQADAWAAVKVARLADNIRHFGLLAANINPVEAAPGSKAMELASFDLDEDSVSKLPAELVFPNEPNKYANAWEALKALRGIYASDDGLGFEFTHLPLEEQDWFKERLEGDWLPEEFQGIDKDQLLEEVFQAENLEQYLSQTYTGQKRFSVEGLETLIPMMNRIVNAAGEDGFEQLNIAMAHRGRINALAHVLDQPYEWVLSMFEGVAYESEEPSAYDLYNTSMDVKYHLGANTTRTYDGHEMKIHMANNPSHLESVAPVVNGLTRAAQDNRQVKGYAKPEVDRAMAIVVHGDASVTGQGVVAETYNFSKTEAFSNGGSVHIIANNNIGFTAENDETRSTRFASDPAKGYDLPVIHVNADKPEAVLVAARLAYDYRQAFHKDVVLDLLGYRRLGHNENDEPRSTNPLIYHFVDEHPTITGVYGQDLIDRQLMTEDDIKAVDKATWAAFDKAHGNLGTKPPAITNLEESIEKRLIDFPSVETKVPLADLEKINEALLDFPSDLHVFGKLKRILERRKKPFAGEGKVDWGLAEALAFATIIQEGIAIRHTGEDAERGTFSHRNLIITDTEDGHKYTPMSAIGDGKTSYSLYNSTLSEYSVMGFEYGYDLGTTNCLVLWEAQYGDFANPGQVMIDQYVSSGRKKFGDISGLVLLLPHGFEGAGPEHSSARVERYLQLCAENNWTVANLTRTSQIFHILRRQAKLLEDEALRPLVIMSPKGLLRNETIQSDLDDFTDGQFEELINTEFEGQKPEDVKTLLLGSGRFTVDIMEALAKEPKPHLALARIEQLYPFPQEKLADVIASYPNLQDIVWIQEEPENQGPWGYMALRLREMALDVPIRLVSRPAMAAPAEGNGALHKATQKALIQRVLDL